MDLDNLTVKEIKQINSLLKNGETSQSPFKVGEPYFIRTVTHHLTGRVKEVTAKEIVLTECAWIADNGRFMQAVCEGKLNEVEPFPQDEEVIVGRGALIDAVRWKFPLPKEQK